MANLNTLSNEMTERIAQAGAKCIYEQFVYENLKKEQVKVAFKHGVDPPPKRPASV